MAKINKEFIDKEKELMALIEPYENWLNKEFPSEISAKSISWQRLNESVQWARQAIQHKLLLAKKKESK